MSYASKVIIGDKTHLVGSNLYGTCDSEASAVTKVVTLPEFDKFLIGVTVHVKFTYANTAVDPIMNINSLGAKPIYLYGTTAPGVTPDTSWDAGAVLSFTYDGTAWIINDWIKTDTGVQQINTPTDDADYDINYRVLLSDANTDITKIAPTRKSSGLLYNPYSGQLTTQKLHTDTDKWYVDSPNNYGINMRNSDIINCNALWFGDDVDGYEGILFKGTQDNKYDILYCRDGVLYVEQQCTIPVDEEGTIHNTHGTVKKMMSEENMPSRNRIRGGSVVKVVPAARDFKLWTADEVNTILGVTNSNLGNTAIYVSNGHYESQSHIIDAVYYKSANNGEWWVHFGDTPSAGSFRFNYIIYYWV